MDSQTPVCNIYIYNKNIATLPQHVFLCDEQHKICKYTQITVIENIYICTLEKLETPEMIIDELVIIKYKVFVSFHDSCPMSIQCVPARGSFTHLQCSLPFYRPSHLLITAFVGLLALAGVSVAFELDIYLCSPRFNCLSIKAVGLSATHTRKSKGEKKKKTHDQSLVKWFSNFFYFKSILILIGESILNVAEINISAVASASFVCLFIFTI